MIQCSIQYLYNYLSDIEKIKRPLEVIHEVTNIDQQLVVDSFVMKSVNWIQLILNLLVIIFNSASDILNVCFTFNVHILR